MEHRLNMSDEDRTIQELRGLLIREEAVPPEIAVRVEAAISREARRITTTSGSEVVTLLCLVFLVTGSTVPWSTTLPVLGIGLLGAGVYTLGVSRVFRHAEMSFTPGQTPT